MSDLPESYSEKVASFKKQGYLEHWMYAHELRALLDKLKPDDWLTPNDVHNLCIGRGNNGNLGIINFHDNEIEYWSTVLEVQDSTLGASSEFEEEKGNG